MTEEEELLDEIDESDLPEGYIIIVHEDENGDVSKIIVREKML